MKSKKEVSKLIKSLFGTLGAIIGAVIGAIIWVILYRFGIIAGVAGLAVAFFSFEGYRIFSKKLNIYGCIISFLISALVVFIINYFTWSLYYYEIIKKFDNITFYEAFKNFENILKNTECYGYYIRDMIIGVITVTIYSIVRSIYTYKVVRKTYCQ